MFHCHFSNMPPPFEAKIPLGDSLDTQSISKCEGCSPSQKPLVENPYTHLAQGFHEVYHMPSQLYFICTRDSLHSYIIPQCPPLPVLVSFQQASSPQLSQLWLRLVFTPATQHFPTLNLIFLLSHVLRVFFFCTHPFSSHSFPTQNFLLPS